MEVMKTLKIEKNHIVEIKSASWTTDAQTEEISMQTNTAMTIKALLKRAEQSVGAVYDARSQNCVKWLLQYTRGWNTKAETYVMQNVEKVLEAMGLLGESAKVITDADVALNGRGKRDAVRASAWLKRTHK